MKKIMTLAILAFLVGGFTVNANAQKKLVDWDQKIKEFENAVDNCVYMFEKMQADEVYAKENRADFNELVKKAEGFKEAIEKYKDNLDKRQGKTFNNACKKLNRIYEKG